MGGTGFSAALLLLIASPAGADEPWEVYFSKDNIVAEKREVAGTGYYEHRAQTSSPLAPEVIAQIIWNGVQSDLPKSVKKREVLSRSENEVVVYDQIQTPVVSDRDVVLRLRKRARPDGSFAVEFETVSNVGPAPNDHYVRIPIVRGAWIVERAATGGSRMTYLCYSEPGGSVPAFMVRGAQRDQVVVDVKRVLGMIARR